MADAEDSFLLTLFGSFQAQIGGQPLGKTRTVRGRQLLAYLALQQGRAVNRRDVALDLWPDSEGDVLRHLSQELYILRGALENQKWRLDSPSRDTLRLDLKDLLNPGWQDNSIDIFAFDKAIEEGGVPALTAAVALYQGPLLAGWNVEWITLERERRQEMAVETLRKLARHATQNHDYVLARDYLRRLATMKVHDEADWRELLAAVVNGNDPRFATQVFTDMREAIGELSPSSQELAKRLPLQKLMRESEERSRHIKRVTRLVHGLPCPLGVLFGRKADMKRLPALLRQSRLLVLTGTGGIGKTSLSVHLAHQEAAHYKHGAWFVSLADIQEGALIAQQIASALKAQTAGHDSLYTTLRDFLRTKHLLLVLDNCEHVLEDSAALLAALLPECPGLHVVATSREALPVPNAAVYELCPLALSSASGPDAWETWRESDALKLLMARVGNIPAYALTPENAPVITEICRKLEGIPLAIELASAQAAMHSPAEMLAALNERLAFLKREHSDSNPRHHSLHAALQWSYNLLHSEAQTLLAQCSIFRGGWTRESAQSVCKVDSLNRALTDLQRASLIRMEDAEGETRFTLLETVREFAREKLSMDDQQELSRRHAQHFVAWMEAATPALRGPEQSAWLDRIEYEHANLLEASAWQLRQEERQKILPLQWAMQYFWIRRNYLRAAQEWMRQLLASPTEAPANKHGDILPILGTLCWNLGEYAEAEKHYRNALEDQRARNDLPCVAGSLVNLAAIAHLQGKLEEAIVWRRQHLVLIRSFRDKQLFVGSLQGLGDLYMEQGNFAAATCVIKASLKLAQKLGDQIFIASAFSYLGAAASRQGRHQLAVDYYEKSLSVNFQIGDAGIIAGNMTYLGEAHRKLGNLSAARDAYRRSLAIYRDLKFPRQIAWLLYTFASLLAEEGKPEQAARLAGAAQALWETLENAPDLSSRKEEQETRRNIRSQMTQEAFNLALLQGRALTWQAAVEEALHR